MKWKNIAGDTSVFFVTGTVTVWQPLLMREPARRILLADLEFYRGKYGCGIVAYVLMPEHCHLVVNLARPEDLHPWLRDVQGHSSSEMSRWLRATAEPEGLSVYRAHANGGSKLAIWKEQARAVPIVTERVLRIKIDYIYANPVRRGLVASPGDWLYSSWRNYYLDDESLLRVDRLEGLGVGGA